MEDDPYPYYQYVSYCLKRWVYSPLNVPYMAYFSLLFIKLSHKIGLNPNLLLTWNQGFKNIYNVMFLC